MEKIRVTFFKDPHRFWFCREDYDPSDEITEFRVRLKQAIRASPGSNDIWKPVVGEVVAFYQKTSAVWDRAKVESISPSGDFTIWLEDLGFPQTVKKKDLRPMPWNVDVPKNKLVREGGLFEVLPAKRKLNLTTMKVDMVDCGGVWSPDAIDLMREVVDLAETTAFEVKCSPDKNIFYGNLFFVMPNGREISARDILADYCMDSERFLEAISRNLSQSLRLQAAEMPVNLQSRNTRQFVTEWVDKTNSVDIQNDEFDESVSTFQHHPANRPTPLPAPRQSPPTHQAPKHPSAHAVAEWDANRIPTNTKWSPKQKNPRGANDVVSPKKMSGRGIPPENLSGLRRGFGRGMSSECLQESVSSLSDRDSRSVQDSCSDSAYKAFLKSKQAEQMEDVVAPETESSRSTKKIAPEPAGMLYGKEMSKKTQKQVQQFQKQANQKNGKRYNKKSSK